MRLVNDRVVADQGSAIVTLPKIGDEITEGMGRYVVRRALGGTCFEVESRASGVRIAIDFTNSHYRDSRNVWCICLGTVQP